MTALVVAIVTTIVTLVAVGVLYRAKTYEHDREIESTFAPIFERLEERMLDLRANQPYPPQRFSAVTACPACGEVGCFTWDLPTPPRAPGRAWNAPTSAPLKRQFTNASVCDVVRRCPRCGAKWGEK